MRDAIAEQLRRVVPAAVILEEGPNLRIPARHPALGDLVIEPGEGGRVAVSIGPTFSTAIPEDLNHSETPEEVRRKAFTDTIDFVSDVLQDQVIFRLVFHGSDLIEVGTFPLEGARSSVHRRWWSLFPLGFWLPKRTEEYAWAGPRPPAPPPPHSAATPLPASHPASRGS